MPRVFALFLCGLGALIVATTLRQSSRARQTRSWTRTTGRAHVAAKLLVGGALAAMGFFVFARMSGR